MARIHHPNPSRFIDPVPEKQVVTDQTVLSMAQTEASSRFEKSVGEVLIRSRLVRDDFHFAVAVFEEVLIDEAVGGLSMSMACSDSDRFESVASAFFEFTEVVMVDSMIVLLTIFTV